jgi:N-acyl-L-homoserine lactone synthetase
MESAMIRLIQGSERHVYPYEIDAMHRLRAKVFKDRMNWPVTVQNGWERDEFDDLNPLYIISQRSDGKVSGSARLLPSTGPNMLANVFLELLPPGATVRSPTIWESSRFSIDDDGLAQRSEKLINHTTAELLCAIVEIGTLAGLEFIVSVVDVPVERVLRRAGCPCDRIGQPKRIGKTLAIAGIFEVGDELLSSLHRASGITSSVLRADDAAHLRRVA